MGAGEASVAPHALASTLPSLGHVCFISVFVGCVFARPLSRHMGLVWTGFPKVPRRALPQAVLQPRDPAVSNEADPQRES